MWEGVDQRRFPRAKYRCTVRVHQKEPSSPISTMTENVGMGGICVLLERGLDIFVPVSLELEIDDGKAPLRAEGTIVWVVRRGGILKGPCFDTGIEFSEISPEDRARLEALIDRAGPRS